QMLAFTVASEIAPHQQKGTAISLVNMLIFLTAGIIMHLPSQLLPTVPGTLTNLQHALFVFPLMLTAAFITSLIIKEPNLATNQ
ncbi:MAG: hypothetical protein COC15_01545, partial [Legionellales bacterium]